MAKTPKTRSKNQPRAETTTDNLPATTGSVAHVELEVTDQDLPDKRTKKFMDKPVVEQRRFDDRAAAKFLAYYAQTGRKGASARAAGVSYNVVRHWEVHDDDFGTLVQEAHNDWLELLERELFRRAVEGVLEPVVAGKDPEIVTYVRKYSDKLLELALKKADPSGYGNREAVNVNVNTGVLVAPESPAKVEDIDLPLEDVTEVK